MFVALILVLVSCVLVFLNSILYVLSILLMSTYVLFFMVSNNLVSTLVYVLVVVVYVGAMMVLIGYICAVCPNPVLLPRLNNIFVGCGAVVVTWWINPFEFGLEGVVNLSCVSDVFFSSWGVVSFFVVVVMLFLTLLIVTSQSSSFSGPFRSV